MIGRAALALAVAAAGMGAARATVWPGAIDADGRALAAKPEGERADAVARFVAQLRGRGGRALAAAADVGRPAHRRGCWSRACWCAPATPWRSNRR